MPAVHIVLVEPQIAPNTGNIARTCVGLGLPLTLVGRLGFSLGEKELRRAGLDYWKHLELRLEPDIERYRDELVAARPVLFTTRSSVRPWEIDLSEATHLCFGSETAGLPPEWHAMDCPKVGFPQTENVRSYNLASSVHSAAIEWVRQCGL
ncbi:MAG: TrmH family RNA methyltransferase [Planctomycetota bacterium]